MQLIMKKSNNFLLKVHILAHYVKQISGMRKKVFASNPRFLVLDKSNAVMQIFMLKPQKKLFMKQLFYRIKSLFSHNKSLWRFCYLKQFITHYYSMFI